MSCDLTCIITGHREGRLAVASLRSFWAAIDAARAAGHAVEARLVLDRPNPLTHAVFEAHRKDAVAFEAYDHGDQGKVRNEAVAKANGRYTAFLDADDLWSEDWLVQALDFLDGAPETHIAHPAYNYFFEQQATIFCHVDQESDAFRPDLLRIANYWDALCVCPTAIYHEIPFCDRDIEAGYAYEDWVWNCETVAAGKVHKVVPESVLFKRRQNNSQTIRASASKSLGRRNPLTDYTHPIYERSATEG